MHERSSSRQRGYLMLEAVLAILLAALMAVGTQRAMLRASVVDFANMEADALDMVRKGVNFYIFDNYVALQHDQAVSRRGVLLAHGATEGQTRRPTTDNLRAMGYLPSSFSGASVLNQASYRYLIGKTPEGCDGASCMVDGTVWIDRPLLAHGSADEPDGLAVSTILLRIGGAGAASLLTAPDVLTGASGSFSVPNPVPGAPAGVVGVRVGFNAEAAGAYVRIGDDRDPDLRGPLTVEGATTLNNTLTVRGASSIASTLTVTGRITSRANVVGGAGLDAGTGAGGCFRSSVGSDGRIVARRLDCSEAVVIDAQRSRVTASDGARVARVVLDGQNGQLLVGNAAGTEQVRVDGSGRVEALDPSGAATAILDGGSGRATVGRAQLTSAAPAGGDCSGGPEGDVVLDSNASFGIVVCRAGTWRRPGLPVAVAGAACAAGSLGQDAAAVAYICRDGQWTNLSDRVTRSVLMARYLVLHGTTVPNPACGAGGVPAILVTPVDTMADTTGAPVRNRYAAVALPGSGSWTIQIRLHDASGTGYTESFDGASYGLRAIAQTFCDYPT